MKRLLLAGGGHTHVEILRNFAITPDPLVSITLVTPFPRLIYTGMLPGHIAGHYALGDIAIDLAALAARARARLVLGSVVNVEPAKRVVAMADGTTVDYDILSFNVGSVPGRADVAGVERHAIPVRPLEKLLEGWNRVLDDARRGVVRSVSIVGGGAGGVELAFAMDWRLRRELGDDLSHVRILTDTPTPLPEFAPGVRRRLWERLRARGIGVHAGNAVAEIGADFVRLANGNVFASDATVWATGAGAPAIFRASDFATDSRGFLSVDDRLQSISHPGVFGAGDCVTNERDPRPKAGVFAVRAAMPLEVNLRAALSGSPLASQSLQRRFLALISTGGRHAVGSWGPLAWQGEWAWRWKDRIDRAFVEKYAN